MRQVSVTELKNRLSHYLRLVKQGETLAVLERSIPVACIRTAHAATGQRSRLDELVRDGIVTASEQAGEPLVVRPIRAKRDVVQALIEERGDR